MESGSSTFGAVVFHCPVDAHPSAHLPHQPWTCQEGVSVAFELGSPAAGFLCSQQWLLERRCSPGGQTPQLWARELESCTVHRPGAHLLPAAARPTLGSAPRAGDRPAGESVWAVTHPEESDGSVYTDMRNFLSLVNTFSFLA